MTGSFFPRAFFVTGTDTGVGKSLVCAILIKGLAAAYWKPIQSGIGEITDTDWLRKTTRLPDSHFIPETFRLTQPLSPHAAAELDGVRINLDDLYLPHANQFCHFRLNVVNLGFCYESQAVFPVSISASSVFFGRPFICDMKRPAIRRLQVESRAKKFQEVELALSGDDAIREARRCLRCDLETEEGKRQFEKGGEST